MTDVLQGVYLPEVSLVGGREDAITEATTGQRVGLVVKRLLDVVASAAALVVLVPLGVLVALLVKLSSPGPVFFRQQRVGAGGRTFHILKFRTMVADAEDRLFSHPELAAMYRINNYKLPVEVDPRVTRLGRWLRKASIDELPQLWNVLKGDMSLVGARPVLAEELEAMGRFKHYYVRMRPGITGHWQVNGRSEVGHNRRVTLDSFYVANWSLGFDVRILLKTIPAVLFGRGAH